MTNKNQPLVSICVPTYNGEKYLAETLTCILNQTYQNLEILVVDDQSSDSTLDVVKEYQKKDVRIRLFVNDSNLGLVANWNRCIELASGDWIKFQFQDDLMLPKTLERMQNLAQRLNVRLVLTDREYFFEEGIPDFSSHLLRISNDFVGEHKVPPDYFFNCLLETRLNENFIGEPILGLIHKDFIEQIGCYDERLKQIVDLEYWLRAGLTEPIGFVSDRLHQFRVHGTSQGAKNASKRLINITTCDKVLIANKILTDEIYQKIRDEDSTGFLRILLIDIITTEFVSNGIQHMRRVVGNEPYKYFQKSTINKFQAGISDMRNFFRSFFIKF